MGEPNPCPWLKHRHRSGMCVSSLIDGSPRCAVFRWSDDNDYWWRCKPSDKAKTLWPRVAFSAVSQRRFDSRDDQRQDRGRTSHIKLTSHNSSNTKAFACISRVAELTWYLGRACTVWRCLTVWRWL